MYSLSAPATASDPVINPILYQFSDGTVASNRIIIHLLVLLDDWGGLKAGLPLETV